MADATMDMDVFAVGVYHGQPFTVADLDEMVANFSRLTHAIKPPVKLGHDDAQVLAGQKDGDPALGWVTGLRRVGEKLVATVAGIPDKLAAIIRRGRYKRVSSEIYPHFEQTEAERNLASGVTGHVLSGIALLGADVPAVKTLDDLADFLACDGLTPIACASDDATQVVRCSVDRTVTRADHKSYASGSLYDYQSAVCDAVYRAYPMDGCYVRDLFAGRVVVETPGGLVEHEVTQDDMGTITLGAASPVAVSYVPLSDAPISHAQGKRGVVPQESKTMSDVTITPEQFTELQSQVAKLTEALSAQTAANAAKDAQLKALAEQAKDAEAREAVAQARALHTEAVQFVEDHAKAGNLRILPAQKPAAVALYERLSATDTVTLKFSDDADESTVTVRDLFVRFIEAAPEHKLVLQEVTRGVGPQGANDAEAWMTAKATALGKSLANANDRRELTILLATERPDLAGTIRAVAQ